MTDQPTENYDETDEPQGGPVGEVLHFDVPRNRPGREVTPFTIGDDSTVLNAHRPKSAILIRWAQHSASSDPAVLAQIMDEFIDAVLDPESADYVRGRFEDPDDEWDYDVLVPVINALQGRWSARPTGPSRPSTGPRRSPGRRSTVRSQQGRG